MHPIVTSSAGVLPSSLNCIGVSYNNGQICADLPILGQYCFNASFLPSGSGTAQACVTPTWPLGCANVCMSIDGSQVGCTKLCVDE